MLLLGILECFFHTVFEPHLEKVFDNADILRKSLGKEVGFSAAVVWFESLDSGLCIFGGDCLQ